MWPSTRTTGATVITTGVQGQAEADFRVAQGKLSAAMSSDLPVGKPAPKRKSP